MATAPVIPDLKNRILAGDLRAISRAATLLQAQTNAGRELMAALFPFTERAMIVGITGPPGAGKSTLIDQLAKALRSVGQTVGIIAVDPSSPYSQGAILGDRIRMQDHHADPGVFIRSMASRGKLGGIARGTLDLALLLDASGRDVVLIETVGVGQDEVEIAKLADTTVLVLVPGLGDDVQALKAGIMEIADVFAINKADLPGADRLEQEIRTMQNLGNVAERADAAPIRRIVATAGTGVNELMDAVRAVYRNRIKKNSRSKIWAIRLREILRDTLLESLPEAEVEAHAERVSARLEDPYAAVDALRALIGLYPKSQA